MVEVQHRAPMKLQWAPYVLFSTDSKSVELNANSKTYSNIIISTLKNIKIPLRNSKNFLYYIQIETKGDIHPQISTNQELIADTKHEIAHSLWREPQPLSILWVCTEQTSLMSSDPQITQRSKPH